MIGVVTALTLVAAARQDEKAHRWNEAEAEFIDCQEDKNMPHVEKKWCENLGGRYQTGVWAVEHWLRRTMWKFVTRADDRCVTKCCLPKTCDVRVSRTQTVEPVKPITVNFTNERTAVHAQANVNVHVDVNVNDQDIQKISKETHKALLKQLLQDEKVALLVRQYRKANQTRGRNARKAKRWQTLQKMLHDENSEIAATVRAHIATIPSKDLLEKALRRSRRMRNLERTVEEQMTAEIETLAPRARGRQLRRARSAKKLAKVGMEVGMAVLENIDILDVVNIAVTILDLAASSNALTFVVKETVKFIIQRVWDLEKENIIEGTMYFISEVVDFFDDQFQSEESKQRLCRQPVFSSTCAP